MEKDGREYLDTTPVAVPAGWQRPLTMEEMIRAAIRSEVSRQAVQDGQESFEEADDFEVDEDPDPLSPYEIPESPQEWPGGEKPVDPVPPPPPGEKIDPEGSTQAGGASAGQLVLPIPPPDSGTVKPPAGKGS